MFLVGGQLPRCGFKSNLSDSMGIAIQANWYDENDLLPAGQRKRKCENTAVSPAAFSGAGHKLGNGKKETVSEEVFDVDSAEDEDLKQAILLSMSEHQKVNEKSQKEIMREKRLKLLGSR